MLITCPACASDYTIDPERIGAGGRKVRCAACRGSWFVAAPQRRASTLLLTDAGEVVGDLSLPVFVGEAQAPEPPPVIEPERASSLRGPAHVSLRTRKPARGARRKAPGSVRPRHLAAAAAAGAIAAAILAVPLRTEVVRVAPGTATLFSAIGLPVNLVGLAFEQVTSALASGEGGGPVLVVEGRVRNVSGRSVTVPPLRLAIEGEAGQALYTWSAKAAGTEIESGADLPFRVRLASPPPAGRRVEVTFRDGRDRMAVALR